MRLGVVIAGGAGTRLGRGMPKALVLVGGRTLLDRAIALLHSLCDEVLVAAPRERKLPVPAHARVHDVPGAPGPLSGIVAGLGARAFRSALVLGVDFPLMRAGTLEALREKLGNGRAIAVVPAPGGVPQPLAAAYAPESAAPLARALEAGERSVTTAVLGLEPTLVSDAELERWDDAREDFFNLNTPEDLAESERRLPARGTGVERP